MVHSAALGSALEVRDKTSFMSAPLGLRVIAVIVGGVAKPDRAIPSHRSPGLPVRFQGVRDLD